MEPLVQQLELGMEDAARWNRPKKRQMEAAAEYANTSNPRPALGLAPEHISIRGLRTLWKLPDSVVVGEAMGVLASACK